MKSLIRLAAAALVTLAVGSSCDDPSSRNADWEFIHAAIIVPSCATSSCHSSLAKTAGIVLDDVDESYDLLVKGSGSEPAYVVPGNVDTSALLYLLEANYRTLMPPDGPLPDADVDLIRAWIEQGAVR